MKTVNVQKRGYKMAVQFEEKRTGGNLRQIDERYTISKEDGPYYVSNEKTDTVNNPCELYVTLRKPFQVPALRSIS